MTHTIGPDSPKAAIAAELGRELTKAVTTRGIPYKEVERVTGIGHTTMDNYRRGVSFPKTAAAAILAQVLDWPKLLEIVKRGRTGRCRRPGCGRTFYNEGGTPKAYCNVTCRKLHENERIASRRIRQGGQLAARTPAGIMTESRRKAEAIRLLRSGLTIAEDRNVILLEAIAAMCRDCEPEGVCRTPDCPLRPHSPLPLARHAIASEPRTEHQVRVDSWKDPERRRAQSERSIRLHAEGRMRGGWPPGASAKGLAASHARTPEQRAVASRKAWVTRRAKGAA